MGKLMVDLNTHKKIKNKKNLKNEKEEENSEGKNLIMSRLKVAVRHKPREKEY